MRELAIAVRCQLLTGSYDNATKSCPCHCTKNCKLTLDQRQELHNHPKVIKAKERNLKEFTV